MIELLTADTPNGKKISIMLEEIQYEYKVTKVNLFKNEQFNPEFKKISPFNKIPVIKDHENSKIGDHYDDKDNHDIHANVRRYQNKHGQLCRPIP